MYIGYDGRNAITGNDRSARYARQLLEALATCSTDHNYVVFGKTLSSKAIAGINALANVHIKKPRHTEWWHSEAWCVWRSSRRYHIKMYHGLDSHLPSGLDEKTPLKGVVSVARLPEEYPLWQRWWRQRRLTQACRQAQGIVVPAQVIADRLVAEHGVDGSSIVVARPWGRGEYSDAPVEEAAQRVTARYKLPPRYVLVMGELVPATHLDQIVKACEEMGREAPHVVIVGRSTKYYKSLKCIEHTRCNLRHIPRPHHEDIPTLMHLATAVVVPCEAHTPTLLNAQRAGRPVIVADTPWLGELGEGAPCYTDATSLAEALRKVLADPESWQRHSKAVGNHRTPQAMADAVIALYKRIREQA